MYSSLICDGCNPYFKARSHTALVRRRPMSSDVGRHRTTMASWGHGPLAPLKSALEFKPPPKLFVIQRPIYNIPLQNMSTSTLSVRIGLMPKTPYLSKMKKWKNRSWIQIRTSLKIFHKIWFISVNNFLG